MYILKESDVKYVKSKSTFRMTGTHNLRSLNDRLLTICFHLYVTNIVLKHNLVSKNTCKVNLVHFRNILLQR